MTAPWKRTDVDDVAGVNRKRVRSLEANCCTEDATFFQWDWNGSDNQFDGHIRSVGGADPSDYIHYLRYGYITGNYVANCTVEIQTDPTGFNPGTGSQWVITLPEDGTQAPYVAGVYSSGAAASGVPLGVAIAYDLSGTAYTQLLLRISSAVAYPALEAFDPLTGNKWGPSFPYTWGDNDTLLAGSFTYFLQESLLGPRVY